MAPLRIDRQSRLVFALKHRRSGKPNIRNPRRQTLLPWLGVMPHLHPSAPCPLQSGGVIDVTGPLPPAGTTTTLRRSFPEPVTRASRSILCHRMSLMRERALLLTRSMTASDWQQIERKAPRPDNSCSLWWTPALTAAHRRVMLAAQPFVRIANTDTWLEFSGAFAPSLPSLKSG